MTGFECYCCFTAIRNHFHTSYDYFKYCGKVKANPQKFERRPDRFLFNKLAARLSSKQDLENFLVANFITMDKLWVNDLLGPECQDNYLDWRNRTQSFSYRFSEDCDRILLSGHEFNEVFKTNPHTDPPILKMFISGTIMVETFLVLNWVLGFFQEYDRKLINPIWSSEHTKCLKYEPFFQRLGVIDTKRARSILRERTLAHERAAEK